MALLIDKPADISKDHFFLRIKTEEQKAMPGQFINIKTGEGSDPLLRRPFSIFNIKDDVIEIVVRQVGRGTSLLCKADSGEIDVLGPLGKGFTLVKNKRVLLVGGGVGNAPLYYLGLKLKELGNNITFIYGARSADYIYFRNEFEEISDTFILTTDDGTEGREGFVTDAVSEILNDDNIEMVYTCGPTIMMKNIVTLVERLPVEVSMENYFGCGIGLCVGCTIDTSEGFKRACFDGPVFDGKIINWDAL